MNWKTKINIHPILDKDQDSDESSTEVSKELAKYLKRELHSYCTGCSNIESIIKDFERAKTQLQANKALDRLYDWADYSSVWLGI